MACDISEPCKFPSLDPSLDSYQRMFLWTHKDVDLALHPVVGLVLRVGHAEKFNWALGFKSLNTFFRISKQGPCFTAMEENGGDERLACEADCVPPSYPV